MRSRTKKVVICALFSALTFCFTSVIRIPTATGGYIHPGDSMVILSGWLLGPIWGALSAGIGSMLSDLLGGYAQYMLPTFIIKALTALVACGVKKALSRGKHLWVSKIISVICAAFVMTAGYYIVEALLLSYGFVGALASVASNAVQGIVGGCIAILLFTVLEKNTHIKEYFKDGAV